MAFQNNMDGDANIYPFYILSELDYGFLIGYSLLRMFDSYSAK